MDIPDRKDLRGANLIETNFQGANFEQADFAEAKLEGAHHLSLNQFFKL